MRSCVCNSKCELEECGYRLILRHCERTEAIQSAAAKGFWIASAFAKASRTSRCARNDDVERVWASLSSTYPGRCAAPLQRVSDTRWNVRVRLILAAPWRRAETGHSCEPLNLKLWIVLPAGVSWYARPCPPGHDCAAHATPATDLTIISVRSHRRRFLATPEHE
jgi:hypothetical protein